MTILLAPPGATCTVKIIHCYYYLKPKLATGSGLGSTFATTTDNISKKDRQNKRRQGNQKEEIPGQDQEQEKTGKGSTGSQVRAKKEIKCFDCEGDHYVRQFPKLLALQKVKEEGKITVATWEGSIFCTYQANAVVWRALA